jgi:hypothetical protein
MREAAAKAGYALAIVEAFRTNERQTVLFDERKNDATKKKKGQAAPPKYSNHQQGTAIDIDVGVGGVSMSDEEARKISPIFVWLEAHGQEFGFDHVEGSSVKEPWHWTHLKYEITGSTAFATKATFTAQTSETAVAASSLNISGSVRTATLIAHDDTTAYSRSEAMCVTPRATFQSELASFNADKSNFTSSVVGQVEEAAVETLPEDFEASTVAAFSYNFDTGRWEDGKVV